MQEGTVTRGERIGVGGREPVRQGGTAALGVEEDAEGEPARRGRHALSQALADGQSGPRGEGGGGHGIAALGLNVDHPERGAVPGRHQEPIPVDPQQGEGIGPFPV